MKMSEMGIDPVVLEEIKRLCAGDARVAYESLKRDRAKGKKLAHAAYIKLLKKGKR